MERLLTFVPVTADEARELASGTAPSTPRQGFSATTALVQALGYQPEQDEDAEYAALVLASVWSLAQYGRRLVLVAELDPAGVTAADAATGELDNGGVNVTKLPAASVVAWFTDEESASELAARAATAARGLDIDAAWELPDVQELVTTHDLLWHGPEELGPVLSDREDA